MRMHAALCAVNQTADKPYFLFDGYAHLASGLSCGLAGLAAGMAIGIVGDAGVRCACKGSRCRLWGPEQVGKKMGLNTCIVWARAGRMRSSPSSSSA
jgi:hypothetical protein